jgi:hypothetical protein
MRQNFPLLPLLSFIESDMLSKSLIVAVLISMIFLPGCGGTRIEHVSAPEFLEHAKQIEQMNSATWTTYIGSSQTRAYLEYGDVLASGGKSRTIVYWTELEKLPEDVSKELKAGKSPWVPWQEQGAKPKDNQPVHSDG